MPCLVPDFHVLMHLTCRKRSAIVLMSTGGGVCLATILARLTAPLGLFIISCCRSCRTNNKARQLMQGRRTPTRQQFTLKATSWRCTEFIISFCRSCRKQGLTHTDKEKKCVFGVKSDNCLLLSCMQLLLFYSDKYYDAQ